MKDKKNAKPPKKPAAPSVPSNQKKLQELLRPHEGVVLDLVRLSSQQDMEKREKLGLIKKVGLPLSCATESGRL
jgi:hypothetical protein